MAWCAAAVYLMRFERKLVQAKAYDQGYASSTMRPTESPLSDE